MQAGYVLVVDDEPHLREIVGLMLNQLGCPVELSANGADALAHCTVDQALPALVFLDLRMPGMSGYEAVQRLRAEAHTRDLPVICLTGEPIDAAEALAAGFTGLVGKPFKSKHLADAIKKFAPALLP